MSKLLFVAFPVREEWSKVLIGYQQEYAGNELFKWTTKENLHMTLVFLGAVEEDLIPEIQDALSEIAAIQQSFKLELKGIEYGPEDKTPSMIWARFKDDINFGVLSSRSIEELTYILGKIETLTPMPHITLSRFNKDVSKPKILPNLKNSGHEGEYMKIDQMYLMESKMTQAGSTYNTISTFKFSVPNPPSILVD